MDARRLTPAGQRESGRSTPPPRPVLGQLLDAWQDELSGWVIPPEIAAAATPSPRPLPRQVPAHPAERTAKTPAGASYRRAWAALDPPGSVLDVGAGAGAACIPLLDRTTALTAVDTDPELLAVLAGRAGALTGKVALVRGSWPQVAPDAAPADVVTCYNVVYTAPDILPFLAALTASARRLVVVELTAEHPLVPMNDLWLRFHGLRRPTGPTAGDLLRILAAMGVSAGHERWQQPSEDGYTSFAELTAATTRRLGLPPERASEVAAALQETGAGPDQRADPATARRAVVTIWWSGSAGGREFPD